jgi:hypothetical protein
MRECPFTGCGETIPAEMFACRRHWFRLTGRQRAEIYAIYGAWKTGRLDGDALLKRQLEIVAEAEGSVARDQV